MGSNSFKDLIDFGNLVSGKIIQKSDPSLRWAWATGCRRPGQNKEEWIWIVWQMVYTDARAYLMHVVYWCMFYHIYFARYDFKTLLIWFI